jgi:sucrose phosphorylase
MSPTFYTTLLTTLYGAERANQLEKRIIDLVECYRGRIPVPADASLSERDAMLITYGDQVREDGQPHLQTLAEFCNTYLRGILAGIHILPFFPWSSDDGFSIKDFRAVDASLGNWLDIERIGRSFRLMVDGVINHASVEGEWFQAFLHNKAPFNGFFITVTGKPDLSEVVRPRALPLLTEFDTAAGMRRVWTTFSADQADLDYHNPDILLEILDILLLYAKHGAQFIRLDAIAFLWKEIGTPCIHLPQTHAFIQLLRTVLEDAAPHVRLITETNVPHRENISYFGDGTNEAHLVYNFALPPLVMHTFRVEDASILSDWTSELALPFSKATFFNFLASHDGIGLNPALEILSAEEINGLIEQTFSHGGQVSYKQNLDGTKSPYELNISYFDALSDPASSEPLELQLKRFMASQAIMLSLRGVPGIYFHSLFGSRSWKAGLALTGQNRTINRQKFTGADLDAELTNPNSLRSLVFRRYQALLTRRLASAAFDPFGGQQILDMGHQVFAVLRTSPRGDQSILCLQNVSAQACTAGSYKLEPFQTLWVDNP